MNILHRRYAWDMEKNRLAWDKIANNFKNCVASSGLKISGFRLVIIFIFFFKFIFE